MNPEPLLAVRDLVVEFDTEQGRIRAVDGVGFFLEKGQVLGIAGESGCGKSVTALSIIRLLPKPVSQISGGQILYEGKDLLTLPIHEMQSIRGRKIAMIFQEPMTALNPVHSVGRQMKEVFELHFPQMSGAQKQTRAKEMLDRVGIPDPGQVLKKYPHQLSGGIRQRVMIAMALSCEPDILIADEPTTALDVTIQAQILELIRTLKEESGMSIILITHDLGVIAQNCDQVVIMYAGRIAETAGVRELFKNPLHPYTRGLLTSMPSLARQRKIMLPTIQGNVPSLLQMPQGCRFADRCPLVETVCIQRTPGQRSVEKGRTAACHMVG
ncbi:MAG TPA: ABC transporter ATP-binding protein [Desulfotignum sp.]|jgi:peptide/nickel transport system ATP-binding protein|nr:ABC transporter ATP-binding protein [Desulfotignum sp.]